MCVYIYIYRERESEIWTDTHIYIYIYIYRVSLWRPFRPRLPPAGHRAVPQLARTGARSSDAPPKRARRCLLSDAWGDDIDSNFTVMGTVIALATVMMT